jgi:hypothetical protein
MSRLLTLSLHVEYLDIDVLGIRSTEMTTLDQTAGPSTLGPAADLADSLDVRLMLAGRLSTATIPLRHDRAELATVLGRGEEPRSERQSDIGCGADNRRTA